MKKLAMTFILAALIFASCSKKADVQCLGGLGGELQVRVLPQYNGTALVSTDDYPVEVHIAIGQSTFPGAGESNYNKTVTGKNNNDYVMCYNLKCGMYYFYVTYTDPQTGSSYSGGAALATEQEDGTLDFAIQLTRE